MLGAMTGWQMTLGGGPAWWGAALTGALLGGSLIVAIGAQNAFVLRQGLQGRHVGLVVAFCIAADLMLMSAGVAGLGAAIGRLPVLTTLLTLGGAAFLAAYGVAAARRALRPGVLAAAAAQPLSRRQVLAQVAAFTFLNPHVYLDTVLLVGAVGAQQPAALRPLFVLGAGLASALWFSALGYGARLLAPWLSKPAAWRWLDGLIALTMWLLAAGLFRLWWAGGA
jgi:L-lysine exporter family protein LysE/ArgO